MQKKPTNIISSFFRTFVNDFKSFKKPFDNPPFTYARIYLYLIPIFSLIYFLISLIFSHPFKLPEGISELNIITYLYFSTITITTLGYGDITPLNSIAQLVTAIESILGLVFIGLFLNALSTNHGIIIQDKEKKILKENNEKERIDRLIISNKLYENFLNKYFIYLFCVITPLNIRGKNLGLNANFDFSDMKDLNKPTYHHTDDINKSAISYYYEYHDILVKYIEEMVKSNYLKDYQEIEKDCINFITMSTEHDSRNLILNNTKNQKSFSNQDCIKKLSEYIGEPVYRDTEQNLNQYVTLYKLIKSTLIFTYKLEKDINTIIN